MANWYDNEAQVNRVRVHLDWFDRKHKNILGTPAIAKTGPVDARLKRAIKDAKYWRGYPDAALTWGTDVDQEFIDRLHQLYIGPRVWARRGYKRRVRRSIARVTSGQTNERGVKLVAEFEGFYPGLYNDPVGHCTAYYGHLVHYGNCTQADYGKWPKLSQTAALKYLRQDLKTYEAGVKNLVKVPLTSNQFSALVSFAFNVGVGGLGESTLLAKLNNKDYAGASSEFDKWVKAGGQTLPGLVRRRNAEQALFNDRS